MEAAVMKMTRTKKKSPHRHTIKPSPSSNSNKLETVVEEEVGEPAMTRHQ
jgi:hypothetical protein